MSDDCDVGYKKPPAQTRFRKGQSGNPSGRPKGSQNLATVLARELKQRVSITERGRKRTITKLEASVKQLVNNAATGDPRAMHMLLGLARAVAGAETAPLSSEADAQIKQALLARLKKADPEDDDGPR
jgi:replication-associated recombination protein RarA